jgi:anti-anti-sigma regulatory factor/HAMP domain-containing protein
MNSNPSHRSGRQLVQAFRDLNIRFKLLVLILAILTLLLASTITIMLLALGQFEERVSTARLNEERTLLSQRFSVEQNALKESALSLALDSSLLAAVNSKDQPSMRALAVTLRLRYQLDYLEIVDVENRALLSQQPVDAALHEALKLALLAIEYTTIVPTPRGALLAAAVPLKHSSGVLGAILVGRSMDHAFLQRVNSNRTDPVLHLYGANGQVVANSTSEDSQPIGEHSIDLASFQQALSGAVAESRVVGADGGSSRVSYIPLTLHERTQMVYSIALTTAEIQAFRTQMINRSIFVLGILGLIALVSSFYFIRYFITRPLTRLSVSAEQLRAGNFDVQLVVSGRDEIGQLTASFSAMAQQLRHSFVVLEQHNHQLQEEIAERKRTEEARTQLQEEVMIAQATILEMSTPLIPIDEQTIVMPLIGALDSQRTEQVLNVLLRGIESSRARLAILDITGVSVVDTQVAGMLIRVAQAVRLLGAQVVFTGIRPEVAQSLVGLGVDLRGLNTHSSLANAVALHVQSSKPKFYPLSNS